MDSATSRFINARRAVASFPWSLVVVDAAITSSRLFRFIVEADQFGRGRWQVLNKP